MLSNSKNIAFALTWFLILPLATSSWAQSQLQEDEEPIKFSAEYQIEEGSTRGVILLSVNIQEDHYIYSLSEIENGPPPSKIGVEQSAAFKLTDKFLPDSKPIVIEHDPVYECRIEKHKGKVVFWVPFELSDRSSSEQMTFEVNFEGAVCSKTGSCRLLRDRKFEAKFSGYYRPRN